jgi:hypothetical protein
VPAEWHERYDSRIEEYQLPKEATKRQAMAEQIGADGWHLLYDPEAHLSIKRSTVWTGYVRRVGADEIPA